VSRGSVRGVNAGATQITAAYNSMTGRAAVSVEGLPASDLPAPVPAPPVTVPPLPPLTVTVPLLPPVTVTPPPLPPVKVGG
jgi:hypothetical protein